MLRRHVPWLTAVGTAVLSTSVYAQNATAPSTTPADDSVGLEEVVVTANRVQQDLQKVSAAVEVVEGDVIQQQALTNTQQIFANVPSVQITAQPAGASIDIRGQGADLPSGSQQGAVALEFDGVYNITSEAQTVGFFDVDRIEVLPGPQSTRYGPNADGGIVNVITKDPVLNSYDGNGTLTYGSYAEVRGEAAQNIALGSDLALRISGAAIHQNSFYEPAASDTAAESLRAKLLYQPIDGLDVKLSYQVDHIGGTGAGAEPASNSYYPQYPNGAINDPSYACALPGSVNDCDSPWNHAPYSSNGITGANSHADLTEQTFVGSLSYRFNDYVGLDVTPSYILGTGDQKFCSGQGFGSSANGTAWSCYTVYPFAPFYQYSGEARLHSLEGSKLVWNLGYYHWNYRSLSWNTNPQQQVQGPDGANLTATHTDALFGDLTYPLTDRLRLIAGLRGSKDERYLRPGASTPDTVLPMYSHTWDHMDYRVGQEFDLAKNSMEYLTVSTGYRPGVLNYNSETASAQALPDEVITAFELGVKNRFFDNTLQLNGDVFYYNQKNYQILDFYTASGNITLANGSTVTCVPNSTSNPAACNSQGWEAQAHEWGIETQIQYVPTPDDRFTVNGTYLDAVFNSGQTNCANLQTPNNTGCWYGYNVNGVEEFFNINGAMQAHSPKLATTVNYQHTFHFASGAKATLGGDWFHTTGYWVHPVEDYLLESWQPEYSTGDLTASFSPASGWWSLTAYVHNVTNYAVKESYVPFTSIGDPRLYGITANVKW